MRKFFCIFASIIMLISIYTPPVFSYEISYESSENIINEILDEYNERVCSIKNSSEKAPILHTDDVCDEILYVQEKTLSKLENAGFYACGVNPTNYNDIENILNTELTGFGISNGDFAVIVITGNENERRNHTRTTIQPSFSYQYNGTTYTLRKVIVTAADIPAYAQADSEDLMHSNLEDVINNVLNAIIEGYISFIPYGDVIGTVASICGLNISNFSFTHQSTLILHGNANWTRTYIQVKNTSNGTWPSGCGCLVERVKSNVHLSGDYYSAQINDFVSVPENVRSCTLYSENYNNNSLQYQDAVIGFIYSQMYAYKTGDLSIYYDGSRVMRFRETF